MQKPPPQPPVFGENIAGRFADVVRQLQKNRESFAGVRRPTPLAQKVSEGQEVMNALMQKKENEQEQNAAPASGALQKEGGQERGRQRDDRQGEAEGSLGQSSQVQGTEEEEQQRRRMR
jgi:hypothetical protein